MKPEDIVATLQKLLDVPEITAEGPEDAIIARILDVAKWSPTAANLQPWEILIVREVENKEKIVQVTLDPLMRDEPESRAVWLKEAPAIMIICADVKAVRARFGQDRALTIGVGDLGGFLLTFRMAAMSAGWTTGIVREFDPQGLRDQFKIPKFIEPLAIIAICRDTASSEVIVDRPTMEVKDFLHQEIW